MKCISIGNLPSSYADSMSYEEQIIFICNYLKNTILPAINNNADIVEELKEKCDEIIEYYNTHKIPEKVSELENDENYITNSVDDLLNYFNKDKINSILTNYYNINEINDLLVEKADISNIPTKTSELTNDSSFINNNVNDLTNYYDITDIDDKLDEKANINQLPTLETGVGTMVESAVYSAEQNHWEKWGKVVSYSFVLNNKSGWGLTTKFITGLPKPVRNFRFVGNNTNDQKPLRLSLNSDGSISNAYSGTTPGDNRTIEGHVVYICE